MIIVTWLTFHCEKKIVLCEGCPVSCWLSTFCELLCCHALRAKANFRQLKENEIVVHSTVYIKTQTPVDYFVVLIVIINFSCRAIIILGLHWRRNNQFHSDVFGQVTLMSDFPGRSRDPYHISEGLSTIASGLSTKLKTVGFNFILSSRVSRLLVVFLISHLLVDILIVASPRDNAFEYTTGISQFTIWLQVYNMTSNAHYDVRCTIHDLNA